MDQKLLPGLAPGGHGAARRDMGICGGPTPTGRCLKDNGGSLALPQADPFKAQFQFSRRTAGSGNSKRTALSDRVDLSDCGPCHLEGRRCLTADCVLCGFAIAPLTSSGFDRD